MLSSKAAPESNIDPPKAGKFAMGALGPANNRAARAGGGGVGGEVYLPLQGLGVNEVHEVKFRPLHAMRPEASADLHLTIATIHENMTCIYKHLCV